MITLSLTHEQAEFVSDALGRIAAYDHAANRRDDETLARELKSRLDEKLARRRATEEDR